MKIAIGLGNPDNKYIHTRHNIGQSVILCTAKSLALKLSPNTKFNAQTMLVQKNLIGITNEYMNNSGLSIQKMVSFYKIPTNDLFLIHDDLDLPVGEWKLQFDRGPAGHNGVISTINQLGTQSFWRFRIGVGHPTDSTPVESYVLQPFTSTEKVIIDQVGDKIVQELKTQLELL